MPPVDHCVLRDVLERQARERPGQVFLTQANGTTWTYLETREQVLRTANALRRLGVGQDDRVLSWLPNGPDALRLWFALNYLGAVYVPINLAYRGRLLEHVIKNSDARLLVAHADLHARLADVAPAALRQVVVLGGAASTAIAALQTLDATALDSDDASLPALARPIAPWDTQAIIYTSGTTGPSKGVLSSYMHWYSMTSSFLDLNAADRFLVTLPLFHVGGIMPVCHMLTLGGAIAVMPQFDTATFWDTVRATHSTTAILLGAMVGFLLRQPERPGERDHSLRCVTIVPFNELAPAFRERFGSDIYTHFNMTEVSMPLRSQRNPTALGAAGRPRPGIEARIVDANDCEVPVGAVGELVVRSDCPWALNSGYNNEPEATARAWRNGWFHTGDAFRRDEHGEFYFVDRLKDSIRRRGENISSFEIESEVAAHPKVKEAAALAVPCEGGEDEVLVAVALCAGETLEPAELIHFLIPRMAHFMVPRYLRFVPELPKTPTQKVQKHLLREMGLDGEVWDREQAGITVKRERIGQGKR